MIAGLFGALAVLLGWPEEGSQVGRVAVAVLVWAAGWKWAARRRGEAMRRRWSEIWPTRLVGLGMWVALGGWFHFLPVRMETWWEAMGRNGWHDDSEASPREALTPQPQPRTGNWLWDEAGRRTLPERTRLNPGNRPEVFLRAEGEEGQLLSHRLYLSAFALGEYRQGGWSAVSGGEKSLMAENDGWLRLDSGRGGWAHRVFLGRSGEDSQPLVALQGVTAVRVGEVVVSAAGGTLPGGEARDYEAVSKMRTLDDPGGRVVREAPDGVYREMAGGELGRRIGELAAQWAGDRGGLEGLRRVREGLSAQARYSLTVENRDDRDPLENFLFYERRGHCEFFATAAALMARALGVPSRVVYGWAGGTYYESGKWFVFRGRDAHAWAEVWLPNYGWVVMDATPMPSTEAGRPALAAVDEQAPVHGGGWREEEGGGRLLGWVLAVILGLFAWAGVVAGSRRVFPEREKGRVGSPGGRYEAIFRQGCRQRGMHAGRAVTLRQLTRALGVDRPEWADELVAYHYGIRYEGRPRDRELERSLATRVRAWERLNVAVR